MTSLSAAGCASADLSGAFCRISLARAAMALTSPVGASANASRALALATQDGIAGDVRELLLPLSVTSVAFLSVSDFTATFPDLRSAWLFQWREPCLADFFDPTDEPAASSDFALSAALSALAAACDCPAKLTKSPVARINAERALALILIWKSPRLPALKGAMRPWAVSAAGQKKGIFGLQRAKAGQQHVPDETVAEFSFAKSVAYRSRRCQRDRSKLLACRLRESWWWFSG